MIQTAKIKNKPAEWSAQHKYRVLDVAFVNGETYVNISGINSVVTNADNWSKIGSSQVSTVTIEKVAGDIEGTDPDFYLDLSSTDVPSLPVSMMVYVSVTGDNGDYLPVAPVNYNPITKILFGMNNPASFPSQKIKIATL